jgi:hypothetical protein
MGRRKIMRVATAIVASVAVFTLTACFEGPKGDKGDKGDTGVTGPAGPAGAAGPAGPVETTFEPDGLICTMKAVLPDHTLGIVTETKTASVEAAE